MLPTKEAIRRNARRSLAAHLGLGGGVVGATLVVALARLVHGVSHELAEELGLGAAVFASTALLTALTIDRALRTPEDASSRTLALSMGAAILNVTTSLGLLGLAALAAVLASDPVPHVGRLLLGIAVGALACVAAALPGLVVSLPLGAVFALAYAGVAQRIADDLILPTHATVPRAMRLGASFLAASALLAGGVWTGLDPQEPRGAVAAAALATCASASLFFASHRARQTSALRAVLAADRHPDLVLVERDVAAARNDAAPLAPGHEARAVVRRAELSAPYRGRPSPIALDA